MNYTLMNELSFQWILRSVLQDMYAPAGKVTVIGTVVDIPPVIETIQSCTGYIVCLVWSIDHMFLRILQTGNAFSRPKGNSHISGLGIIIPAL